jgi:hypothetical protein
MPVYSSLNLLELWYLIASERCLQKESSPIPPYISDLSSTAPVGAMAPVKYFPGTLIYSAGFNVNQNFKKKIFLNNSMFQFFSLVIGPEYSTSLTPLDISWVSSIQLPFSYFSKIHLNGVFTSSPWFSKWLLFKGCPDQNFVYISCFQATCPVSFKFPDSSSLTVVSDVRYFSWCISWTAVYVYPSFVGMKIIHLKRLQRQLKVKQKERKTSNVNINWT